MADRTLYQQLRQTGFMVNRFGMAADMDRQTTPARKAFDVLQRSIRAAQDVMKDYEMSEAEEDTRLQVRLLPKAVKSLEKLRESLLKASEYDLVGAVDVAQLSAQLDEMIDSLK